MEPKFYIFLDIDGVLNDYSYVKSLKMNGMIDKFNPESIKALNYLISQLNQNYDPILVISSSWRNDMASTTKKLYQQGLEYYNRIFCTPITCYPNCRGKEILDFLEDKPDKNNFVIIDDENFDFWERFPSKKIIKTDYYNHCFTMNDVQNFLINLEKEMVM